MCFQVDLTLLYVKMHICKSIYTTQWTFDTYYFLSCFTLTINAKLCFIEGNKEC